MRTSDLIGREVVDVDGRPVGRVHDLRLATARSAIGDATQLPVEALVTGHALGSRLGYAHGDVRGPWVLERLLAVSTRRARLVPVDQVGDLGPPIRLSVPRAELRHPREPS